MSKEEALDAFGSVQALALALGISRHAVYQWGDTIPEMRALQIRAILADRMKDADA